MKRTGFFRRISPYFGGLSLFAATFCASQAFAQTNHFTQAHPSTVQLVDAQAQAQQQAAYQQYIRQQQIAHAHYMQAQMRPPMVRVVRPMVPRPVHGFQQWVDYEPEYRIYPGDQLDIVVSSAPELSRTLTVGPDGRIVMPMAEPVMAAGKTFSQLRRNLSAQLGKQLRDPTIAITPRAYAPSQIFVGGEVTQPGTYTLPGPVGALEAIFMAGGFRNSAKTKHIAVLRRAPNGGMMMRVVNIGGGLKRVSMYNDTVQLRRGDIIFVPRTTLAEVGMFMQAIRDALPVDFNVSYQLGLDNNGGGAVAPIVP